MSKSQNPTKEVIPIMKKRIYRRMPVNDFQPDSILQADLGGKLIFAIDVAKVDMVAAVAAADGRVLQTVSWKAPDQNSTVLAILRGFRSGGIPVETVMEPSGTYGDVLRHQLQHDAFPVFMISGKRTFDAREIFDGVPSLHDAKSAAIIARLHADGLSSRPRAEGPDRRQLRAALAIMDLHQERYLQLVHRLESWLARHWPELPTLIELTSSSLMALLARVGGPADVAAAPDMATKVLLGISHRLLPADHVAAIIASAKASVGVPLVGLERDALMAIADDAYRAHRAFTTAKTQVDKLAATTPAAELAPVVGHTTAAAVFAEVGDARSYSCTRAFVKAMGLNLKEKSSGTVQGQLKITKRGPSRVRQYLWLAVFRWIQTDPIANAWYQRKKQRDGGRASRAAVALMRKLAKALYHVGRGATFDSSKLFDVRRLQLQERRLSRGTLRIFDLTEFPLPAESMPKSDILLERFVYPGRLPPDISLAPSRPAHQILTAAISSCGTDLVCPLKPGQSLFFSLALGTSAATACSTAFTYQGSTLPSPVVTAHSLGSVCPMAHSFAVSIACCVASSGESPAPSVVCTPHDLSRR
jgi:transposase